MTNETFYNIMGTKWDLTKNNNITTTKIKYCVEFLCYKVFSICDLSSDHLSKIDRYYFILKNLNYKRSQ